MKIVHQKTKNVTKLVLNAAKKARTETTNEPEPHLTTQVPWPVECVVGPGLEGAIACESKIGYVNGSKGWLIYRGYDIFDLCAHSTYEEVSYLLLHGVLPTEEQLESFKRKLIACRKVPESLRLLIGFPIEKMSPMAALRMGTNLMRQEFSYKDLHEFRPDIKSAISADEDSIPMETKPKGGEKAIYEFKRKKVIKGVPILPGGLDAAIGYNSCYHLIAGVATITAAIARIREGHFPIEPDPELSHSANFLYMLTGKRPTPEEARVMDIALILHADHGMNASTFASMVVASTLSDIYFSVGAGIAALSGPLHGGANEQVIRMLDEIGDPDKVTAWYKRSLKDKRKIMGFGHRVYKAYDPRARVLAPLADYLIRKNGKDATLFETAKALEEKVIATLGAKKKIFPNVDFYSGIVYHALGIAPELFTSIFAVSRVAGWAARVMEYLENNRIFRPRAMYTGPFGKKYTSVDKRELRA